MKNPATGFRELGNLVRHEIQSFEKGCRTIDFRKFALDRVTERLGQAGAFQRRQSADRVLGLRGYDPV